MSRSGLAGLTEYAHQSFTDILNDISTGSQSVTAYIKSINSRVSTLEEKQLWKKQPFDFKNIIHHALRHYNTTVEELNSIHEEIQHEVKANHVTRLKRISEVAREINVDIGRYWNQDYEQHKDYDNPDFSIVEYLYADTRDTAAYLLDFANMAERLNDFIGKQKIKPDKKLKLELSHKLSIAALCITLIVALFGNNLCSRLKPGKDSGSPNTVAPPKSDSAHKDTTKPQLQKQGKPPVVKNATPKTL